MCLPKIPSVMTMHFFKGSKIAWSLQKGSFAPVYICKFMPDVFIYEYTLKRWRCVGLRVPLFFPIRNFITANASAFVDVHESGTLTIDVAVFFLDL